MNGTARRALLGSALAGGLVATTAPAASAAAWTPAPLKVSALKAGDLVVGPGGAVLRLAAVSRLSSGRYRLAATDPATGAAVALDGTSLGVGHLPTRLLMVLARGVAATTVRLDPVPTVG